MLCATALIKSNQVQGMIHDSNTSFRLQVHLFTSLKVGVVYFAFRFNVQVQNTARVDGQCYTKLEAGLHSFSALLTTE